MKAFKHISYHFKTNFTESILILIQIDTQFLHYTTKSILILIQIDTQFLHYTEFLHFKEMHI